MHDSTWQGSAKAQPVSVTGERLIAQIKSLAYDVEELLKATAGETGSRIAGARARAEASLRRAQEDAAQAGREAARQAKRMAVATDRFAHANPWQLAGIALVVGIALGLLSRRD
jgi:ElaB/YqjD/DUF883 family membrane-anchored ribosome-binding protein